MLNGWTSERKARQAELIRTWRPWEQSTGPTTPEGRLAVTRNAWRGGHRQKLRELARMLNAELQQARDLINRCGPGGG